MKLRANSSSFSSLEMALILFVSSLIFILIWGIPLSTKEAERQVAYMPEVVISDIESARCIHGILFVVSQEEGIRIATRRSGGRIPCMPEGRGE